MKGRERGKMGSEPKRREVDYLHFYQNHIEEMLHEALGLALYKKCGKRLNHYLPASSSS
jgi:hypothetical protein